MKNKLESHADEGETADFLSKDTRVFNEKIGCEWERHTTRH